MARQKKTTVDYFPHYVHHDKTIDILESYYGNDGYAFFYKLLELLGVSEGHCYDCSIPLSWEYLLSFTRVSEQSGDGILQKLAEMKVIDTELWNEKKIWMETFVERLSELYRKRVISAPEKPPLAGIIPSEMFSNNHSSAGNPQSKEKKTKGKQSKEKNTLATELPVDVDRETWDEFVKMRRTLRAPLTQKAKDLILQNLETIYADTGQSKNEVLLQSIKNSWRDIYPIKQGGTNGHRSGNITLSKQSFQKASGTRRGNSEQGPSAYPIDHKLSDG